MIERRDDGSLVLNVRLTPRASGDAITGIHRDAEDRRRLAVSVRAVPEKGKANGALEKLLAKRLGLPKGAVHVAAGQTSRLKTIHLDAAPDRLAAAMAVLNALSGEEKS